MTLSSLLEQDSLPSEDFHCSQFPIVFPSSILFLDLLDDSIEQMVYPYASDLLVLKSEERH